MILFQMWAGGYEDRDFGRSDEQVEWVGESPKQVPSIFPGDLDLAPSLAGVFITRNIDR